jgi:preprotein translocase subunit SecE
MTETVKESRLMTTKKNFVKFFREIRAELKKVIWPSRQQLINNTATVLATCLVVGIVIWVADLLVFEKLVNAFFTK